VTQKATEWKKTTKAEKTQAIEEATVEAYED